MLTLEVKRTNNNFVSGLIFGWGAPPTSRRKKAASVGGLVGAVAGEGGSVVRVVPGASAWRQGMKKPALGGLRLVEMCRSGGQRVWIVGSQNAMCVLGFPCGGFGGQLFLAFFV